MKIYVFFLFLLFSLAGCCSPRQPAVKSTAGISGNKPVMIKEQAKPQDPYFWDFGSVEKGEILKHDFVLQNSSKTALNITGVNTSCGCTISEIGKNKLSPGENTAIKVQFDTKGYQGETQQFVYVNTDDAANPILKFTIKAYME